jgi:energy-converting hydrogenase Eha subunit A
MLMDANSLLIGVEGIGAYVKAIVVAITMCIVCIAVSIPAINKKQL